jgi:lysophospholipase
MIRDPYSIMVRLIMDERVVPNGRIQLFSRRLCVDRPLAQALVLHGYGDHSGRYEPLMRDLAIREINSVAFDFRGHGRSNGRRGYVRRWGEFPDDVRAVAATLERPDLPLFIVGHSHGGLVAAAVAQEGVVPVAGLVMCSPFLSSALPIPTTKLALARVTNVILPWLRVGNGLGPEMMTADPAMIQESRTDPLLLRSATPRWFYQTLRAQRRIVHAAPSLCTPLLMLIGQADIIADPTANQRFFDACASPDKTLHTYSGLRHELLRETARQQIFQEIATWITARTGNQVLAGKQLGN